MFYKLHFPFKSLQKYKLIIVSGNSYTKFNKMKKKISYSLVTLLFLGAMLFNLHFDDTKNDLSSFNLDALTISQNTAIANEIEGDVDCYDEYSGCWIFGCSTIVYCKNSGDTKCPAVKADDWEDKKKCTIS